MILLYSLVKKGDPIAVVDSEKFILADKLKEEASLMLVSETEWDKGIERNEDPVEYIKQLVQLIEAQ